MSNSHGQHKSIQVATVTWPQVEQALKAGATAILPVGAACKQHGEHLPMNTDQIQAEYFAEKLMQDSFIAVWPTVTYGHYPAFVNYPGSVSLSEKTFAGMVAETGISILTFGASRLVILNTGISTIRPLEAAVRVMNEPKKVSLVNVYAGTEYRRVCKAIEQQPFGSHADEIETSIMLTIAPEVVDMQKVSVTAFEMTKAPLNRERPDRANYSPTGVYGDASMATAEKGRRLIIAILSDIHKYIDLCN